MNFKSHQLNNLYVSEKEMEIYQGVIERKHLDKENIKDLFKLNLFISQELYLIVNLIETIYKKKLHQKMTEAHGTQNWFINILWLPTEHALLQEAAKMKINLKSPVRILDDLPLKFWTQTLNVYYHDILYTPAIRYMFPNYDGDGALKRSVLRKIFIEMHNYRNCVAHQYVIIHEENKLLECYNKFLKFIYWMDEDYYKLAVRHSRFPEYHKILVTSSFNPKGMRWYIMRKIKRFFRRNIWKFIRIFYTEK